MPRVAHVITTLDVGGAEKLLAGLTRLTNDTVLVVSLGQPGRVAPEIEAGGIPVVGLGLERPRDILPGIARLTRLLRDIDADVVQTWMYHADLIGGWAARRAGVPGLAWSLHASDLPSGGIRHRTLLIRRVNALLSHRWPDAIVCTSEATLSVHEGLHYARDRMQVIRNGFPVRTPDASKGRRVRQELGIPDEAVVIARVGRLDAQKDWGTLAEAWARLLTRHPLVHVIGCGRDVAAEAPELAALREDRIAARVHLLGLRDDIDAVYAASDIAVSSSSFGETFPLVIGEAMAAGVPVVTTDVGDCRELVGPTGHVVPPRDIDGLATGMAQLVTDRARRVKLGTQARQRVGSLFSLDDTAAAYHELHQRLARHEDIDPDA